MRRTVACHARRVARARVVSVPASPVPIHVRGLRNNATPVPSGACRHRAMTTAFSRPLSSHLQNIPQTRRFRTSPYLAVRLDSSTIDFAFLPENSQPVSADELDSDPYSRLRVPLLPDNFAPDRSQLEGHGPEEADAPLATPEIVVVAAHPDQVVPAVLTEVEGIGVDGIELMFAHEEGAGDRRPEREPGMLTDLWRGLVDDILGPKSNAKPAP